MAETDANGTGGRKKKEERDTQEKWRSDGVRWNGLGMGVGRGCKRKTSKNNRVKYRERIGRGLEEPGEGRGELWSGRVQGSEAEEKG